MDIGQWLRGIGLEQYAKAFAENDIDDAILPEITVDDLIAIGIASVGRRYRCRRYRQRSMSSQPRRLWPPARPSGGSSR